MKIVLQISMFTVPIFFALYLTKGNKGNRWMKFKQFIIYFILINGSTFLISYLRGVKGIVFSNMTYSYCIKWLAMGMVFALCYSVGMNYVQKHWSQIKTFCKRVLPPHRASIVLRATLFLFIFAVLLVCFNFLFQPVWLSWNNYDTMYGFYKEPQNTIETIFLGPSHTVNGIVPMELYENYGICSYNLGSERQPMLASYYWLEEAYRLHPETLASVVLDVSMLRQTPSDAFYHKGIDAMHFSPVKFHAVQAYTGDLSDALLFLFPIFSYHERWTELDRTDFEKITYDADNYKRGYNFDTSQIYFDSNTYRQIVIPSYYPDYGSEEQELDTESLYFLKQMIEFCDVHDIKLILIRTPGTRWSLAAHNAVQKIAGCYDIDFLDFNYNPLLDAIGYNQATDNIDGYHLNYFGAKKLTTWLGNYLVEKCRATDVRGIEGYGFMEEELAEYHSHVTDGMELKNATDPAEYLSLAVSNENYVTFVAVKDEASVALTEEQRRVFASLGLTSLSELGYQESYLAVIDGGAILYEQTETASEETERDEIRNDLESITMEDVWQNREKEVTEELTISHEGILPDGTAYVLTSGGYEMGNRASLTLNGKQYASNKRGLNIVLYDKIEKEVVDSAVFDTYASSIRAGGNLEAALAAALEYTDDYTTLSSNLRKLYLYNIRCENSRNLSYLKQFAGEDGLLTYLDGILSNEDYAVFLSVKDEASKRLGDEVRSALYDRGFETLSELEYRDSYLAVILGGTLVYEVRDHGEEAVSVSDAWFPDTDNRTSILYSVTSGGYESGNVSSVRIGSTEYSTNSRGINIVVWDTITNTLVDSVVFDTFAVPVRLEDDMEQTVE